MAAATQNFTLEQGSTWSKQLTFYSDSAQTTTINLSSYTWQMQIRKSKEDPTVLATLSSANGKIDTTNAATGILVLTLTAAETAALNNTTMYYDLEGTVGSNVTRYLEGTITNSKEVTRL